MKKRIVNRVLMMLTLGSLVGLPGSSGANEPFCGIGKTLSMLESTLSMMDDQIARLTDRVMLSHQEVTDLGKALEKARACGAPQSKIDDLARHLDLSQTSYYMEKTDFADKRRERAVLAQLIKRLRSAKNIHEIRAIYHELGNICRCGMEFTAKECLIGFALWEAYKLLELSVEYNRTIFELCNDPDTQWTEQDFRDIGAYGLEGYLQYLCEFYSGRHDLSPFPEIGGSYIPEISESGIWPEKPGVYRCDGQIVVYESFGGSICRRCY